jgi:predicted ATPase
VLPRHQTLLASVDWSHDLLSDDEQVLLRRLYVFVGNFTAEAAEAVASGGDLDGYVVPELIGRLVDKSLVHLDDNTGRYQLLETIRQYALERCRRAGELVELRDRHMRWAVDFLESIDHDFCDRSVSAAIDNEYPNLRTALEWSTENDPDCVLRLVDALSTYWGLSGRHRDSYAMAIPVLAAARDSDPLRWAAAVSRLSWAYVSTGNVEFIATDRNTRAGNRPRCG